jgi:NAD(P)-dependent dehydrogenase (short-subunit alcohol dehydrogenase family)
MPTGKHRVFTAETGGRGVDFGGKVVLVTGGSRGLGRCMVEAFADRGANVIIASRKIESCELLAAEIRGRTSRKALPVACNVSDWAQCDALVDTAYAEFGGVDVLVNNAGMSPLYPSLEEVGESLWDKVIGLNLKGPFRLAARVGTQMAADGGGSIINISSMAAIRPAPGNLPYAAAKAGLNALTEGFAQAFGPSVRVNTIQCGAFRTDVSQAWTPQATEALAAGTALGRVGDPAEIVGAALYFASEASSFCTGATLRLDGGLK